MMFCTEAPGDCGTAGNRASGGSARAGVGACDRESGCEDAAIVLACDMRQVSPLHWTARLAVVPFGHRVHKHWMAPGRSASAGVHQTVASVEQPLQKTQKQSKAASAGTTEDQPGGDKRPEVECTSHLLA